MPFVYQIRLYLCALFLLTIQACSSNSSAVYYKHFDFSQVENYSFYDSDAAFYQSQHLNYVQRSRIELAIEKKLASQGFNYSELKQADIIVTYHIINNERDYMAYNKIVNFCTRCIQADIWLKEDDNWQAYAGGIVIDLITPKANRSVWRSIYPLDFKEKDNSSVLNNKIIEAVNVMLSQYPNK